MSYQGAWSINNHYNKGDIIFDDSFDYYICCNHHVSKDTPMKKNCYWVPICTNFLTNYLYNWSTNATDINHLSTKTIIQPKKLTIKPPKLNIKKKQKQESKEYEDLDSIIIESPKKNALKRKLDDIEDEIYYYKKSKNDNIDDDDIKSKILLLKVDISTKTFILDKFNGLKKNVMGSDSDYNKGMAWIKTVLTLPFGKYNHNKISTKNTCQEISTYFKKVKSVLDKHVHGLDNVKQEIIEYIAKRISNPNSKGQVLALVGVPGVAKTCLLKSLAEALELPFQQINFGGLSDSSILTGHSETYIGSKPGKIVEALQKANAMNLILYLDEIDKISSSKSKEINGILTHLLDEQQNSHFQDNYLSNVDIDLSKAFFVVSFNDLSKISNIVSDRMKIVYIDTPTIEEKVDIASLKLIPEIIKDLNFEKTLTIFFDQNLLYAFIKKNSKNDEGVRQIKKKLETIFNKINYLNLTNELENFPILIDLVTNKSGTIIEKRLTITQRFIDLCISHPREEQSYLSMYM
jgi:ATP-dependent Lon protease